MAKEIWQGGRYWESLWLIGIKMMIGCEDWMICRVLIEVDDYRNQSMRGNLGNHSGRMGCAALWACIPYPMETQPMEVERPRDTESHGLIR